MPWMAVSVRCFCPTPLPAARPNQSGCLRPASRPRPGGRRPGAPASHRRCISFAAATPTGPRSAIAVPRALCAAAGWWTAPRSPAAAGGPILTCARRCVCDDVGAGAHDGSPAGANCRPPGRTHLAVSARRPARCAVGGGPATAGPRADRPRGSELVDGSADLQRLLAGRSRRAPAGVHHNAGDRPLGRPCWPPTAVPAIRTCWCSSVEGVACPLGGAHDDAGAGANRYCPKYFASHAIQRRSMSRECTGSAGLCPVTG